LAARQRIVAQMRALRAEREQTRVALPPSALPALESAKASEDPEDLLEQADALRDSEDKVRQRLRALEQRMAEVRDERDFDRRMNEFLGDESLFDEQDRRLRLRKPTSLRTAPVFQADDKGAAAGAQAEAANPPVSTTVGAPTEATTHAPTSPTPVESGSNTPNVAVTPGDIKGTAATKGGQPHLGSRTPASFGGVTDLKVLETEQKRLKALADSLKSRASQLESQAKELQ
jgi:hypothetical protein